MRKGLLATIALALIFGVGVFMAMGHIPTAQARPAVSLASLASYHYHFKGQSAWAGFSRVDENNIVTTAYVSIDKFTNPTTRGRPTVMSQVYAEVIMYDVNTDTYLMDVYGNAYVSPGFIQFGSQLRSATLATVAVTGSDYVSGSSFTITLNGVWMGAGSLTRNVSSYHYSEPGLRVNGHFHGASRPATMTGNISVTARDGSVVVSFNNATAEAAELMSSKSGEVDIFH